MYVNEEDLLDEDFNMFGYTTRFLFELGILAAQLEPCTQQFYYRTVSVTAIKYMDMEEHHGISMYHQWDPTYK